MDRLCTNVIGLDGRGTASHYGSVAQWLDAMAKDAARRVEATRPAAAPAAPTPAVRKSKKLSYKEQQEWDGMEAAVTAAEEAVAARQAEVEAASTTGHTALTDACRRLEEAQAAVEKLYSRWQELEARRVGD
jgi:ATP-binding cassette subfamily F protein uup